MFKMLGLSSQTKVPNLIFVAGLAFPAVALLLVACGDRSSTPPVSPAPSLVVQAAFLGNSECKECHQAEFKAHHASRHDLALRPMDRQSLGSQAPSPGVLGNSGYVLTSEGGGFGFGRTDG